MSQKDPQDAPIPLRKRPGDLPIVLFFAVNLLFITYMVDLEQLVVSNPAHFSYPLWPPGFVIDVVHRYARAYDPLILARPVWWKMTIWIDALFFGPFYALGLFAFTRGRDWIRIPSIIYGSAIITVVIIILGEELAGPHATPHPYVVLLLNAPWILIPLYLIVRMGVNPRPFSEPAPGLRWPGRARHGSRRGDVPQSPE